MRSYPSIRMALVFGLALLLAAGPARAQEGPEHQRLPIQHHLYKLGAATEAAGKAGLSLEAEAERRGFTVRDGEVNFEIVNREGPQPIDAALVARFGGRIDYTWRHRASIWMPPDQIIALARALPPGYVMLQEGAAQDDEGPGLMGSDTYRQAPGDGDGTGITVAMIDTGFGLLSSIMNGTDGPAVIVDQWDYADNNADPSTNGSGNARSAHGTACLEMVFDHAPNAQYLVYNIGYQNITHLGNAVDRAIANGADIISMSLSFFNQGWEDGSGDVNLAMKAAVDAGLLVFNSAGNRAQQHWRGPFQAASGGSGNSHDWDASGSEDQFNSIMVGSSADIYLQWDTAGGSANYDLYIWEVDGTFQVVDSSTNAGTSFERVTLGNAFAGRTVQIEVRKISGGDRDLQLFVHNRGSGGGNLQFFTTPGSITSPSNSTDLNVISVGAVDWRRESNTRYDNTSGATSIIAGYSSQGPTNSGNIAPDVAGPTGTTSAAWNGSSSPAFTGTSCATPNVAGAAAAFWSAHPDLSASGVRYLLFEQATLFKDWGDAGADNVYGHGGVALHPYHVNTVWVDRGAFNIGNSPTLPFRSLDAAQQAATSGGRLALLGPQLPDPEPGNPVVLNKALLVESVSGGTVIR